jgi:ketosteroid isomerase-like protein
MPGFTDVRHRSFVPALLFAVVLPALGQTAAPPAPLPSLPLPPELDRVLRDYERAWSARDAVALSQLFAEDGFVLSNGKPPVRGRAAIRAAYAESGGPLALRAFAYSMDGRVGYIVGGFGRAAAAPDSGKFVLALRRVGDRWQIAADMDNGNQTRMMAPTPIPMPAPVTPPSSAE